MTKQYYALSFRQEAINLAITSTDPIAKIARDLGVKENTLYNWISNAKKKPSNNTQESQNKSSLIDEIFKLKKELARVKENKEPGSVKI